MKKTTFLSFIAISLTAVAVSLLTYVFLRTPSSPLAALAEVELTKAKELNLAGFGTNSLDIFSNYTSWPSSPNFDPADTVAQPFYLLTSSKMGTGKGINYYSYTDINSDELADIIIHDQSGGSSSLDTLTRYFAIFLNQGDLQFNLAYKCAVYWPSPFSQTIPTYYGDCAAL